MTYSAGLFARNARKESLATSTANPSKPRSLATMGTPAAIASKVLFLMPNPVRMGTTQMVA